MRRRDFIVGLTGSVAGPIVGTAQQPRLRRVAVLMLYAEADQQGRVRAEAFRQGLAKAGWETGRNIVIDYLWGGLDADLARTATAQLRRQTPDVIVANSAQGLRAIAPAVSNIPVVFIGINEPVALGFVASLAHPGGSMTGFTNLEPTLGSKWLDLLKTIAPEATRVIFIYHPESLGNRLLVENAIAASKQFSINATASPVREPVEIDAAITALGLARIMHDP
jgi:putative tryptophan/tyrosine transport system substrate-binding protein